MLEDTALEVAVYFGFALPFVLLEKWRPAAPLKLRRVLARDLGAYLAVLLGGMLIALGWNAAYARWPIEAFFANQPRLPSWAIAILAVFLADWTIYWLHRGLHTRLGWPAHRWHHSVPHMYWFSGVRASVIHNFIYGLPALWLVVLHAPPSFYVGGLILTVLCNHWMHTNWSFRSRALERVFITPRLHHVHHSNNPEHYGHNFGSLFSLWDHLHGTYLDPDSLSQPIQFGIPERVNTVRLVVGV